MVGFTLHCCSDSKVGLVSEGDGATTHGGGSSRGGKGERERGETASWGRIWNASKRVDSNAKSFRTQM